MHYLTRCFFVMLVAIAACTAPATAQPDRAQPMNVVFILADDMGWMDSSTYGSRFYRTPNLDRLAERGMLFTDAYAANPLCSPTRASILTGQYPGRIRMTTPAGHLGPVVIDVEMPAAGDPTQPATSAPNKTRLENERLTIAEVLKQAGYATAFVGKWHLGSAPYVPENQGFDVNIAGGRYPGPPSFFSPYRIHNLPDGPEGEHICDRLTTEAIDWMKQQDGPFFLNYWLYDVHAPFQGKSPLIAEYEKRIDPNDPQRCATMGAMLQTMDTNIGRLLDAIDEMGIADNTLIVFTSDNGGNMYNWVDGVRPTSNTPLRGGKAMIYEGGVRVPLIVVVPGTTRPASISGAMTSTIDHFPTILDLLGLATPEDAVIDGISFAPVLAGEVETAREVVFCHYPQYMGGGRNPPMNLARPCTSVRVGDWKLIRFYADGPDQTDRFELYDLSRDIGETHNLADQYPDIVGKFNAMIDLHLETTDALVPKANPAYRLKIEGWTGVNDIELTHQPGAIVGVSTGSDPFIVCDPVPAVRGPLTMRIRMRSEGDGDGQVFWSTTQQPGFAKNRSAEFIAIHNGQPQTYEVSFQANNPLKQLRIDPSRSTGQIEIDSIELFDSEGRTQKAWRFD